MRTLLQHCKEWLASLPETLEAPEKQTGDNQDPMYRLFARESSVGRKLLAEVRKDLADVIQVCEGTIKQTNHLRMLMSHLTKATIPENWRRYKTPRGMAVSQWIPNLALRLEQLQRISQLHSFDDVEVWLGGLFFPEAYVTATRQAVAHRNEWSLETLHLRVDIEQTGDPGGFIIQGLVLEGAAWSDGHLKINDGAAVRLGASQVRWVQVDETSLNENGPSTLINLPVYLGSDRSDILFTVDLPFEGGVGNFAAMRAVCVTAGA